MEYATGVGGAKNPEIPEQHILKYGSRVGKIWKLKIKLQIKRSEKRYKFSIVYCFFSDLTHCISLSYDNSDQNKNEALVKIHNSYCTIRKYFAQFTDSIANNSLLKLITYFELRFRLRARHCEQNHNEFLSPTTVSGMDSHSG